MIIYIMPRHFYTYRKRDPKGYQTFSDNLHNSFVAFTHMIGLSKYFSFTPLDFNGGDFGAENGGYKKDYDHSHNSPNKE